MQAVNCSQSRSAPVWCCRAARQQQRPAPPLALSLPPQPRCRRTGAALRVACFLGPDGAGEVEVRPGVFEGFWSWRGNRIRYQRSGAMGPPVVLAHGLGGNCEHWRKNLGWLGAAGHRAWAVDLLGHGYSDKPDPLLAPPHQLYCVDTWGSQLADFLAEVVAPPAARHAAPGVEAAAAAGAAAVGEGVASGGGGGRAGGASGPPVVLVGNSVGGMAALRAALLAPPGRVAGVQLIDCALRRLHEARQAPLQRPLVAALQALLRRTALGQAFFRAVATPEAVRRLLLEAYGHKEAVTDELVDVILKPGLQPGAPAVFLDAISDSKGPLPEELLSQVAVPVSILWGAADPWETLPQARALLGAAPSVVEFIELPDCGHCPQDEAPEMVNPLIQAFVARCQPQEEVEVVGAGGNGGGAAATG